MVQRQVLALAWLGLALALNAWISDDGLITFRYALNVSHGWGAVFEWGERVQGYTHPLWFLMLSTVAFVSGPAALAFQIAAGPLFVLHAAWLWCREFPSSKMLPWLLVGLTLSNGWVDFASSGLEGGLAIWLCTLAVLAWKHGHRVRVGWLGAMMCLTRPDYLLIATPLMWSLASRKEGTGSKAGMVLGFVLPLAAWHLFAFVYYGDPLPNTFYAKAKTAIPRPELMAQGLAFLTTHFVYDAASAFGVLAGGLLAWRAVTGERPERVLAVCLGLYVGYIVWIGGDFMIGRFLQIPLTLSVLLWCLSEHSGGGGRSVQERLSGTSGVWPRRVAALFVVLAVLNSSKLFHYGYGLFGDERFVISNVGVFDERSYYVNRGLGVWALTDEKSKIRGLFEAAEHWAEISDGAVRAQRPLMSICGTLGWRGILQANARLVDACGLTDAFLARLPFEPDPKKPWRTGHFSRKPLPAAQAYYRTLETGVLSFADPEMERRFMELQVITRGPLWNGDRLWLALKRFVVQHTGG